jgi:hypothetical protein
MKSLKTAKRFVIIKHGPVPRKGLYSVKTRDGDWNILIREATTIGRLFQELKGRLGVRNVRLSSAAGAVSARNWCFGRNGRLTQKFQLLCYRSPVPVTVPQRFGWRAITVSHGYPPKQRVVVSLPLRTLVNATPWWHGSMLLRQTLKFGLGCANEGLMCKLFSFRMPQ